MTFLSWLFLVLCGFATMSSTIREFCTVAIIGLFTDFILQMTFYVPVLSIDIRRIEVCSLSVCLVCVTEIEERKRKRVGVCMCVVCVYVCL